MGLRVEITGSAGPEYTYDLSFDELAHAAADDVLVEAGPVTVIVPADTVERLRGSVLDLPRTSGQGGLVIRNPNRPDPLAGVELNRDGTIAEQVEQLLEQAINPSLAAHGGFASLVGVDESSKVYIKMGGGCQGCSASALTLTAGHPATDQGSDPRGGRRHRRDRPRRRRESLLQLIDGELARGPAARPRLRSRHRRR